PADPARRDGDRPGPGAAATGPDPGTAGADRRDRRGTGRAGLVMKAILLPRFGDPDVLEFVDVPCPEPGPGQVRIRVHAVVVARTKAVALRSGRHPVARAVTLPHFPGTEHAGAVEPTGAALDPRLAGRTVSLLA